MTLNFFDMGFDLNLRGFIGTNEHLVIKDYNSNIFKIITMSSWIFFQNLVKTYMELVYII